MDITNQSGQIDEELQLLKTEIKQVLHNVQENVFNAQDPFVDLPSANETQEFATLADAQEADFVAGPEGQPQMPGTAEQDTGLEQASPAELSDFLASAGGPVAAPAGPVAPVPTGGPAPDLGAEFTPSVAVGEVTGAFQPGAAPSGEVSPAVSISEDPVQNMAESTYSASSEFEVSNIAAANAKGDSIKRNIRTTVRIIKRSAALKKVNAAIKSTTAPRI